MLDSGKKVSCDPAQGISTCPSFALMTDLTCSPRLRRAAHTDMVKAKSVSCQLLATRPASMIPLIDNCSRSEASRFNGKKRVK